MDDLNGHVAQHALMVALAAAERGRQAGDECAQQQGDEHPQCRMRAGLAGRVGRLLCFRLGIGGGLGGAAVDSVDSRFCFSLRQARAAGYDLAQVGAIIGGQAARGQAVAKILPISMRWSATVTPGSVTAGAGMPVAAAGAGAARSSMSEK